jgi:hypothetical protein
MEQWLSLYMRPSLRLLHFQVLGLSTPIHLLSLNDEWRSPYDRPFFDHLPQTIIPDNSAYSIQNLSPSLIDAHIIIFVVPTPASRGPVASLQSRFFIFFQLFSQMLDLVKDNRLEAWCL